MARETIQGNASVQIALGTYEKIMNKRYDVRQILSDQAIRELVAEIDANTMNRIGKGQRLVQTENGLEWCYFVRADGRPVDEDGNLLN